MRIKHYNYSNAGLYYITICTYKKEKNLCNINEKICDVNFDEIDFDKYIEYTGIGELCVNAIKNISENYKNIEVDSYVIMPNHIHMILCIEDGNKDSISKIVSYFKSFVSRNYNRMINDKIEIWQKSFYDHVIRNEEDYKRILEYVVYNPLKWKVDEYYK